MAKAKKPAGTGPKRTAKPAARKPAAGARALTAQRAGVGTQAEAVKGFVQQTGGNAGAVRKPRKK